MPDRTRRLLVIASAGLGLLAVLPAGGEARPLLVLAAASLQTALDAIAAAWRKETGRRVLFAYAATPALARQLEQGAPADLFASADPDWMDWAGQRGLIRAETRRTLLGNTLVLIEPADRPATPLAIAPGFPLAQALGGYRLAMGNPASVPAGKYARAALSALGIWDQVAPRIAGADTARAALALVARGEARFGIVYATDAKAEPRVRVLGSFPAASHPPIAYPFAVTAGARHPDAASFLAYLSAPAAKRIFEAEGFLILE
ncbi:molybdate ABC transporter substrate-binding protein [Rhabdaerophilum calidifontis]|uniref:molybdate ABC transporter substrate-binding protein n=1 Tax=Rhabdaerophilum calidifontis TaxID=2604328 RepID=UPI00123A7C84|nr:molybdate ABC transporter substrate-binding protein [Rhabdaerophilum calidifontis]